MFILWGSLFSTKWMEEIEKYGGYPTDDKFNDITHLVHENKMPDSTIRKSLCRSSLEMVADLYRDLDTFRILVVNL